MNRVRRGYTNRVVHRTRLRKLFHESRHRTGSVWPFACFPPMTDPFCLLDIARCSAVPSEFAHSDTARPDLPHAWRRGEML